MELEIYTQIDGKVIKKVSNVTHKLISLDNNYSYDDVSVDEEGYSSININYPGEYNLITVYNGNDLLIDSVTNTISINEDNQSIRVDLYSCPDGVLLDKRKCKYFHHEPYYTPNNYDLYFDYNNIPVNIITESPSELLKRLQRQLPLTKILHLNLETDDESKSNTLYIHSKLDLKYKYLDLTKEANNYVPLISLSWNSDGINESSLCDAYMDALAYLRSDGFDTYSLSYYSWINGNQTSSIFDSFIYLNDASDVFGDRYGDYLKTLYDIVKLVPSTEVIVETDDTGSYYYSSTVNSIVLDVLSVIIDGDVLKDREKVVNIAVRKNHPSTTVVTGFYEKGKGVVDTARESFDNSIQGKFPSNWFKNDDMSVDELVVKIKPLIDSSVRYYPCKLVGLYNNQINISIEEYLGNRYNDYLAEIRNIAEVMKVSQQTLHTFEVDSYYDPITNQTYDDDWSEWYQCDEVTDRVVNYLAPIIDNNILNDKDRVIDCAVQSYYRYRGIQEPEKLYDEGKIIIITRRESLALQFQKKLSDRYNIPLHLHFAYPSINVDVMEKTDTIIEDIDLTSTGNYEYYVEEGLSIYGLNDDDSVDYSNKLNYYLKDNSNYQTFKCNHCNYITITNEILTECPVCKRNDFEVSDAYKLNISKSDKQFLITETIKLI